MTQTIIVIGLFVLAGFMLGRKLYKTIRGNEKPGCEKCAANSITKSNS